MKVERKEKAFEPVVITLETQEELERMWDVIYIARNNSRTPENKEFATKLYTELENI